MWLETQLGGYVQLAHVAQLIPGLQDGGGRAGQQDGLVRVVMASGIEQVLETGFVSAAEAEEAIRAVLHLARLADRGIWVPGQMVTFRQALEGTRRLTQELRRPPAPEGASSFAPAPGKLSPAEAAASTPSLSPAEVERADEVLAAAGEHARSINQAAAGGSAAERLRGERWD